MMKKYNKPEIVTLALEAVDVIETSGELQAAAVLNDKGVNNVQTISGQISTMNNRWSW